MGWTNFRILPINLRKDQWINCRRFQGTESISGRINSVQCPVRSTCWCSTTTRAAWWILKLTDGNNKAKQSKKNPQQNKDKILIAKEKEGEEEEEGGI